MQKVPGTRRIFADSAVQSEFLAPTHAAALVGCDPGTLREYARRGIISPTVSTSGRALYSRADVATAKLYRASRKLGRPPKKARA